MFNQAQPVESANAGKALQLQSGSCGPAWLRSTLTDDRVSTSERKEGDWKFNEQGQVSNRSLAEMIVSSLYYAKPGVISEADYERAVDIVEEEINVVEAMEKDWCERQRQAQNPNSQPSSSADASRG